MQNIVLQNTLIDTLDNVVVRIEEIVTDKAALSQINMDILKNDIRALYRIVCQIEQTELEHPATPVHKMKDSVNDLKQKLEAIHKEEFRNLDSEVQEALSFRPIVEENPVPEARNAVGTEPEPAGNGTLGGAEEGIPASRTNAPVLGTTPAGTETENRPAEEEGMGYQPEEEIRMPGNTAWSGSTESEERNPFANEASFETENATGIETGIPGNEDAESFTPSFEAEEPEKNEEIDEIEDFPDTDIHFIGNEEDPAIEENEAEGKDGFDTASTETETATEAEAGNPVPQEEPDSRRENTFRHQELADFMPVAGDEPESYVTELTAMAQAQNGKQEQDMSQVAVSSTAMPDEKVAKIVAKRWSSEYLDPVKPDTETQEQPASPAPRSGIFSKLKETEALHKGNPAQSNLKFLFEKFKAPKTVNDMHQKQVQDFKSLIDLNEKFLFINNLFKGDITGYKQMLEDLGQAVSRQEMENIVNPLKEQYQWDSGSLAYLSLYDLLDKRFPPEKA